MSGLLQGVRLPALVVIVLTAALIAWYSGPLNPDVSGQFWLARAMRNGAQLYTDFVEINPPLWFWMAIPIDWLAQTLGVRSQPVTVAAIGTLVVGAVFASVQVIRGHDRKSIIWLLTYVAALIIIMPMQHLEQREHLALIGAVPYLFLAAARRRGDAIAVPLAVGIGVAAALGFALKPYFLAVPVLIEVWIAASLRREWRPFRAENLSIASVGALYAGAVITFTPAYLTDTIPMLLSVYEAAAPSILESMDVLPIIWACMLAWLSVQWRAIRDGAAPMTIAFLIGFVGFGFSYIVQHKGWLYQGLPATACLAIAIAVSLIESGRPGGRARLFLPALLVWPFAFPITQAQSKVVPLNDIAPAIRDLRAGDAFGLISTSGPTMWPSTIDRGLRISSRYGQYWMLVALDARPRDPLIRRAAERAVRETAADYRCLPPDVIIFTRVDRAGGAAGAADDPYRYFIRFPEFRSVLDHYRLTKRYGIIDAYERVSMPNADNPPHCRHPG